jgi:glycosyltransferase involved in cell wall biosynthesis
LLKPDTIPLVTVLLPVYNGEPFLAEAITSILLQTLNAWDCLIIDDCSTDRTPEIAASFQDPRIRYERLPVRSGICVALNSGIALASGRYIARMDADDICTPNRFERQIQHLTRYPHVGLCGSSVLRFGDGLKNIVDKRPRYFSSIKAAALFDNPIVHSSVMLRRDLLIQHGFAYREQFRHAEDYDLWTRLFEVTTCENLRTVLLHYREHGHSVTAVHGVGMDEARFLIAARLLSGLGLKIDREQLVKHCRWGTQRLDVTSPMEDLQSAREWLGHLLVTNRTARVYEPVILLTVVRQVWYALVYRALSSVGTAWRIWREASFTQGDWLHGMLLLAAMIRRNCIVSDRRGPV